MSEQAHVTNELEAGACGLDGEELTAELLRENLMLQKRLSRQIRMNWCMAGVVMIVSACAAMVAIGGMV